MFPSNIPMSLVISGMLMSQLLKLCSEWNAKHNLRLLLALTSSGVCSADCKVMFLKDIFMSWWEVELTMHRSWQQKISAVVSVHFLLLFPRLGILRREPFIVTFAPIFDWNLILSVEAAWTHCFTAGHAWKYCASVMGASWRLTVASFCCTCPVYWSYFNDICSCAPVFFILVSL